MASPDEPNGDSRSGTGLPKGDSWCDNGPLNGDCCCDSVPPKGDFCCITEQPMGFRCTESRFLSHADLLLLTRSACMFSASQIGDARQLGWSVPRRDCGPTALPWHLADEWRGLWGICRDLQVRRGHGSSSVTASRHEARPERTDAGDPVAVLRTPLTPCRRMA